MWHWVHSHSRAKTVGFEDQRIAFTRQTSSQCDLEACHQLFCPWHWFLWSLSKPHFCVHGIVFSDVWVQLNFLSGAFPLFFNYFTKPAFNCAVSALPFDTLSRTGALLQDLSWSVVVAPFHFPTMSFHVLACMQARAVRPFMFYFHFTTMRNFCDCHSCRHTPCKHQSTSLAGVMFTISTYSHLSHANSQ